MACQPTLVFALALPIPSCTLLDIDDGLLRSATLL